MRQTGCGDGDHWGGQGLAGLTAAQPLVTLKINQATQFIITVQLLHSALRPFINSSVKQPDIACEAQFQPHDVTANSFSLQVLPETR